jgi:ubiquinone/menaquinone biosynthesis C-methylase UbiE
MPKIKAINAYIPDLYKNLIENCGDTEFQNFMNSEYELIKKIKNSKSKTFIDLGAGHGRLVKLLSEVSKESIFVEKNPSMFPYLENECKSYKNTRAVEGDIFDINFIASDYKVDSPIIVTLLQNTIGTVEYAYRKLLGEIRDLCVAYKGELIISFFRQEYLEQWGVSLYKNYFQKMVGEFDVEKSNFEKGLFVTKTEYTSKWRNAREIEEIISYLEAEEVQSKIGRGFAVYHLRFPMLSVKEELNKRTETYINELNKNGLKSFDREILKFKDCPPYLNRILLGAIPEYYFKIFGESKNFSDYVDFWAPENSINQLNSIKGVVTAHSLSPHTDTVFLFCDLGRTLRIASSMGKKPSVLIADNEWSAFNKTVMRFGGDLASNENFRNKLYSKLGCDINHCGIGVEGIIPSYAVKNLAAYYEDITKSLFGEKFIHGLYKPDELNKLVKQIEIVSQKEVENDATSTKKPINLYNIPLIKEKLAFQIDAILEVKKNLKDCSKETFIYYFAQRFNQHNFADFFKIAVRSEKNFDLPFYNLDKLENKFGIKHALYFKDYVFNSENNVEQFVLPYYFPSGSFLNSNKDDDFKSHVITLDDADNEVKVLNLFSQIKYPHNARMIADLMSFCQFLIYPFGANEAIRYDSSLEEILDWGSKEFTKSWQYYFVIEEEFHKKMTLWNEYMFYKIPENLPIPYFYFPFILIKEQKYKEKINQSFYKMFKFIIENLGA